MSRHKAIQMLQVQGCVFLRFPENHIAVAHRDFGKHLSSRIVRDRKICARIPVALPTFSVMLNHPSGTNARQSERFREIVDYGCLRQSRCRFCLSSVVNRVIHLVTHKLDSTRRSELVQPFHLRIAHRRACWMMRAVHHDQVRPRIRELHDLFDVDAEVVFPAYPVKAGFNPERLGQRGKGRVARPRQYSVGSRLSPQPHQDDQSFRSAGHDLHALRTHTVHFGDRLPQPLATRWTSIDQLMIEKPLPLFLGLPREVQQLIHSPTRTLARGQVELNIVLVVVQPQVQQEWLQLHVAPRKLAAPFALESITAYQTKRTPRSIWPPPRRGLLSAEPGAALRPEQWPARLCGSARSLRESQRTPAARASSAVPRPTAIPEIRRRLDSRKCASPRAPADSVAATRCRQGMRSRTQRRSD